MKHLITLLALCAASLSFSARAAEPACDAQAMDKERDEIRKFFRNFDVLGGHQPSHHVCVDHACRADALPRGAV